MNKLDKIELEKSIKDLQARKNELSALILAENSVENAEKLHAEAKENAKALELAEIKLKENSQIKGEPIMSKYISTENAVKDFFAIMKNSQNAEAFQNSWEAKLAENDLTITDKKEQLPKRLFNSIESTLGTNPIFKAFKVTHVGALLLTQGLKSSGAKVQTAGTNLTVGDDTLEVDGISPQFVYKVAKFGNRTAQLNLNFDEMYLSVVADAVQAIVDKIVELALVEGDGTTNGFLSIANEKDTDKVKAISGAKYVDAIEQGVDFTRSTSGAKYLIVTTEQRKAILDEVRALNPNARVRNNDAEIASEIGVDELLIYTGSATLKPTVLVQDAYTIDMEDVQKIDAYVWDANAKVLVIQSLASGKMNKFHGGAVITVTAK